MPLFTLAFSSIPVQAGLLSLGGAVVVVSHPTSPDAYAFLGALVAALMALTEARYKDRSLLHTLGVFLITITVGSIAPGVWFQWALYNGKITEADARFITWHIWAGAGLITGTPAWGCYHAVRRIGKKIGRAYGQYVLRKYGIVPGQQNRQSR